MFIVTANMILDKINSNIIIPSEENMGVKLGNDVSKVKLRRAERTDGEDGNC